MNYYKTYSWGLFALVALLSFSACQKETPPVPSNFIDPADNEFVRDWYSLSLTMSQQCAGYTEPIAARALSYISFTMYEALRFGFEGWQSHQVKLDGFPFTVPQPDPQLAYHWGIVANEAMGVMVHRMYESAGTFWTGKVEEMRLNYTRVYSENLPSDQVDRSISLGRSMGRTIWKNSLNDGNPYTFLNNYPKDFSIPSGPGFWIPTSPDYKPFPLLPYWGNARPVLQKNRDAVNPISILQYSDSPKSLIYAEALEVYSLSESLSPEEKEDYNYFNKEMHGDAVPFNHVVKLALQLSKDKNLDLPTTLKLFCCLSYGLHDGFIAAWNQKYKTNLLRVSSYIRQNISKFYIPHMSSEPIPDFVSEEAVTYSIGAEILSAYIGYRQSFMDHTQSERPDLRSKSRSFSSFREFAKEASFIDLSLGVHFRTSIESGLEMGYDIAQNVLAIGFEKR